MARISQVALIQQPSFHTLTIRKTINFINEFSALAGYSFEKTARYLDEINELPGGPPIICFHNMDMENLDLEIGYPVSTLVDGKEDITANTVPSQKAVFAVDMGPYEQHDATLGEILEWMQINGYEPKGEIYYQYLNDNERPESEYLTTMTLPIK